MKNKAVIFPTIIVICFSSIFLNAQVNKNNQNPITNSACTDMSVENGWGAWKAATGDFSGGIITYNATNLTPASPRFNLTTGAGIDACTPGPNMGDPSIPVVAPDFGTTSIQLGQIQSNGNSGGCSSGCVEQTSYSFSVGLNDTDFVFSYAIVMEDGGHATVDQPFVSFYIYDQNSNPIPCTGFTHIVGFSFPGSYQSICNVNDTSYYIPWKTVGVNLSSYVGQTLTVIITNSDCGFGDHFAHSYWDFSCNGMSFQPKYCPGQQISICAPNFGSGYTYEWYEKGNPNPIGFTQCLLTISQGDTLFAYIQQPSGCNFYLEYYPVKDTCFNLLEGSAFSDTNGNCIMDGTDSPLMNWIVKAEDTSLSYIFYGSANSSGDYNIWVFPGNYSVSLINNFQYWNQSCPLSPPTYTAVVSGNDTVGNMKFGAEPSVYCPDLSVSIGTNFLRLCQKNYYYVQCSNIGTSIATNVLLKIDFDNPLGRVIPLSSSIPWDSISGTKYYWKIDTLFIGQQISFSILDSVSCNPLVLGQPILVNAQILPLAGDCNIENNYDDDFHTVIASSDPNEKSASTSSNKIYTKQASILPSDTIDYIIHFQNTGTDTAFTVVIYDTVDSDLNIPSVISGASSHPYTFEVFGTGILKWTFNNILLPDSGVNELESHGFVKFQILQKPNNPNGTAIKNSAGIVFDFNAPVITDTVVLTINTVGIQDINSEDNSIIIYPNPSNGKFQVTSSKSLVTSLEIYNVMGAKVYEENIKGLKEINITLPSGLGQGIYFLKLKHEGGVVTKKIVVQK